MESKEDRKKEQENMELAGIAGASVEAVQRFGSAAKEYLVGYSGEDREAGKTLAKGLRSISEQKVNPDYEFQNIQQQAGFSAEVKEVANVNAEHIISGADERLVRTDDIGRVNDPLYDHVMLDGDGNIIDASGTQMKFVGASASDPTGDGAPARAFAKLKTKKFEKYLDHDVKISVPSDYYDRMLQEADKEIEKLTQQLDHAIKNGNSERAEHFNQEIAKVEKIKNSLVKSTVSSEEAVYARLHPELSTAKSVVNVAHRAGLETAEYAAMISGSASIVKNVVAVAKGEVELEDAAGNVIKETATGAAVGYGTGFAGSALKGVMQNARSSYVRTLSQTNLAGTVVAVAVSTGKTMQRYFAGEINGQECFEELGQEGTGMISAAMFSTIGQIVIPIPVVGGMVGSMIGYALSSATYGILRDALKEERLARERRIIIERACQEHIELMRMYRLEIQRVIDEYLSAKMDVFQNALSSLQDALGTGNVDGFIDGANRITTATGHKAGFSSFDEFDKIMQSQATFTL